MPYTNDDAYTEGWNDAMKEMDELKKENAELQQERQQKRDGDDQWRKDSIIYHKLATSYEKDIVKLKDEIAGLKELLEQYDKSRDAWMIKCDERYGEIVELKKLNDLKDLTITQLQKENEKLNDLKEQVTSYENYIVKLKDEQAKTILETKVNTWRECQMVFNSQFDTYETLEFITQECISGDKQLIKEVFDGCEEPFYWDIEKNDIINGDEDSECSCEGE